MNQLIHQIVQRLKQANSVVCLTGAGVSAESGLDTFRDAQTGLWSKFDPQQLATQAAFTANPSLVWQWYMARLESMQLALPNPGHIALAQLAQMVPEISIVTQNIDDLHERGGSSSVAHLHGSIAQFRCNRCEAPYNLALEEREQQAPPNCPACGDLIRPDIVWFGEALPHKIFEDAWSASETCDVMFIIGTSGVVYPAAQLPYVASQAGAFIADINPAESMFSELADVLIKLPSGEALPQIVEEMKG